MKDAVKDAAGAKSLQNSCKAALKKLAAGGRPAGSKRAAGQAEPASSAKRARRTGDAAAAGASGDGLLLGPEPMAPAAIEKALELPVFVPEHEEDEARMAAAVLQTNRAPLVLAFAVELLRYTMPEQPVSSRLSLGQAVVSANSRSKATSLGMAWARGPSADDEGWGAGQPRIRILGREVAVLKRSGYTWKGEEEEKEAEDGDGGGDGDDGDNGDEDAPAQAPVAAPTMNTAAKEAAAASHRTASGVGIWATSQTISLKDSTFVARATTLTEAGQRAPLIRSLMQAHPTLMTATHNAWAYRVRGTGDYAANVRQDSYDDGETGCGDLMLRVMQELGAVDTLVVLTRWFGGTMLGPDRWRLMRNCVTGALAERLRRTGAEVALGGEAAWGLDLEAMRNQQAGGSSGSRYMHGRGSALTSVVGMPIHQPEGARSYLLKSFATAEAATAAESTDLPGSSAAAMLSPAKKKRTLKSLGAEKEANLGLLLGALRLVFDSWADHLTAAELDRRAWSWYVAVRPDVDSGPSGWGAKGLVKLGDILALRRPES